LNVSFYGAESWALSKVDYIYFEKYIIYTLKVLKCARGKGRRRSFRPIV
jgi:hypothetical protein